MTKLDSFIAVVTALFLTACGSSSQVNNQRSGSEDPSSNDQTAEHLKAQAEQDSKSFADAQGFGLDAGYATSLVLGWYGNCFLRGPAANELSFVRSYIAAFAAIDTSTSNVSAISSVISGFYVFAKAIGPDLKRRGISPVYVGPALGYCRTHTDNAIHQLGFYGAY